MKPPRWSRHLNIFHLHRGIQIFKRHLPSLLRPPVPVSAIRLHPLQDPCRPTGRGRSAVLLIEPNFDRSRSLPAILPFPGCRLRESGTWAKFQRDEHTVPSSATLHLSLSLSLPAVRNVLLPHLPEPAESSPLRHPCATLGSLAGDGSCEPARPSSTTMTTTRRENSRNTFDGVSIKIHVSRVCSRVMASSETGGLEGLFVRNELPFRGHFYGERGRFFLY